VSPARKPSSSRSSGAKKSPAKKTAAKKTTARKTAAKKPTTKAKKTTTKKTAAKKAPARKTAAKKTTAKKSAKATKPKKTTAKAAPKSTAKKTTKASAGTTTGAKKTVASAPAATTSGRAPRTKPVFTTPIRKLPVKKSKPARPAKLDAATLKKIKEQLTSERGNLVKQQEELEEDSFEGTQSDLTGEVGLDEDFADAGTATFDRERDLSIRNNIRDLIDQIDRAVRRIDEGVYGTCERCGRPIDAARVKALPHASLCLDCKRREERVR